MASGCCKDGRGVLSMLFLVGDRLRSSKMAGAHLRLRFFAFEFFSYDMVHWYCKYYFMHLTYV